MQVLNETSLWWFNKTQHITPNAVVSVPDRNVTIARKCSVFPVEFVGEFLPYSGIICKIDSLFDQNIMSFMCG